MAIRKLIVTLETVTPMFLAGADNETPELRAPSVVGQLRYWLRAALGGVVGDDLEALKKAEAEVFGDNNGTGAVSVRVKWKGNIPKPVKENALPHPSAQYPAYMWGFPAEEQFQVILIQKTADEHIWLAAISALLLMVSIGGLGRRCRRGWGTVRIVGVDTSESGLSKKWDMVLSRPIPLNNVLKFINSNAKKLCEKTNITLKQIQSPLEYTILPTKHIYISEKNNQGMYWTTYNEAINDFGENEHHWLQANKSYVKSVGFAIGKKRQASPLWLRVVPKQVNRETRYNMVAILFDINFRGSNYQAVKNFLINANFTEVPR